MLPLNKSGLLCAGMSVVFFCFFFHQQSFFNILVAWFAPESLAGFAPEWVAGFSPK